MYTVQCTGTEISSPACYWAFIMIVSYTVCDHWLQGCTASINLPPSICAFNPLKHGRFSGPNFWVLSALIFLDFFLHKGIRNKKFWKVKIFWVKGEKPELPCILGLTSNKRCISLSYITIFEIFPPGGLFLQYSLDTAKKKIKGRGYKLYVQEVVTHFI